jgi:hypothetical protein
MYVGCTGHDRIPRYYRPEEKLEAVAKGAETGKVEEKRELEANGTCW